jgi:hypothetical protein
MTMKYTDQIRAILDEIDAAAILQPPVQPTVPSPVVPMPPTPGPQTVTGYSRVFWHEWPDDSVKLPPINTIDEGGISEPDQLIVIAFTPTIGGSASISPWPNDGTYVEQRVSISTIPGDLSQPFPYARHGQNVGIQWQVGGVSRVNCILEPGVRVYLNFAWSGQPMRVQV